MNSSTEAPLARAWATWFGCGLFPWGPGTVGSLAAVLIGVALCDYFGWQPWALGALAAVLFLPSVLASDRAARASGKKDPGFIVVDEVLGQWIAAAGATVLNRRSWVFAFILFRAFDILKPPPARQLERLNGGWGIMADDVMAGVYAALVMWVAGCFNLY